MRLPNLVATVVCDIVLLLSAPRLVAASDALWIQPSTSWYGIDGTWSNFGFAVGSPAQIVFLTVATALSETWLIEPGGCGQDQICADSRGGLFDPHQSETWRSLGAWQLGMNYTGMEGNGDYGLDTVAFVNTIATGGITTSIDNVVIGALNDTDYYQGFLGVGVNPGRFGQNLTDPIISQLAGTYGYIPSHSYGYTAGAYYRANGKVNGTVGSLTLGGYDTLRFLPHDTQFRFNPNLRLPTVRLRGITAAVSSPEKAPSNWTSTSQSLVTMDDSIEALIDSSTPYLWLPTEVCDRFAKALNLTWREDLGVYVMDGAQYRHYLADDSLSFTFSLSSFDNTDNFGKPFDVPGVVNITVPATAFAQLLRFPFKGIIKFGDSAIPYFPLKRSTREINNNQYIIGRAFLQEAYIITNYDKGKFSVHQALFPEHASSNYSLKNIERPVDSPYPAFNETVTTAPPPSGLSTGTTVGIVLSAFAIGSVLGVLLWCCCRRRKRSKSKAAEQTKEAKEGQNSADSEQPRSPVKRMFTIITGRKKQKRPEVHEVHGSSAQPVEVGADVQHQVFELPVPPEPAELDCNDHGDEDTELGTDNSHVLSEYEITRRKLERQLHGPAPTYTPTADPEKSMHDISTIAHYRPSDDPSPVSSPTYVNTNSLPDSLPSPMTAHPDWIPRVFGPPSPMTVGPPSHSHQYPSRDPGSSYSPISPHSSQCPLTYAPSSVSRSDSDNVSPTSPVGSTQLPSPTYQRTPIDPTRVICLGPLPEGVELPNQQPPLPRIVAPSNRMMEPISPLTSLPPGSSPHGGLRHSRSSDRGSNDSLGSNFTVEEETHLGNPGISSQQGGRQQRQSDDDFPRSPRSMERIEAGSELIHVPQVAEKRYSWEQDHSRHDHDI
ncbi:aspartic peptidase domain-containing protein [Cercophora scortea]|uniref:Aspartic peptidase domain-containing protein n=1 Tax=Cercophora scortea TaxID=314031 RepID=A0AAE0IEP6_9PEZI|nr:aspartic peptidase domain-containing protein [Cercophora scortea]